MLGFNQGRVYSDFQGHHIDAIATPEAMQLITGELKLTIYSGSESWHFAITKVEHDDKFSTASS